MGIVVPINEQNVHWWLAVVCHPRRALESAPGDTSKPKTTAGEMPRIVCLDSAVEPPPKGRTVSFLRGYLWREWCERHPDAASSITSGRDPEQVRAERVGALGNKIEDVPKQANGYDCGIFIIEYLLHLLR